MYYLHTIAFEADKSMKYFWTSPGIIIVCAILAAHGRNILLPRSNLLEISKHMEKILCYGDSLTAGYFRYGSEFHPYGSTLAKLSKLHVHVAGMSGWTTEEMVQSAGRRNNEDVVYFTSPGLLRLLKTTQYDLVCVMAGTNDLGTGVHIPDIVENLRTLTKMCLNSDNPRLKVALLTIPPAGSELDSQFARSRRSEVNEAIAQLAAENHERVFLLNSINILPMSGTYSEMPTEQSEAWDIDLLHLSPIGSERLGRFVYESLVALKYIPGDVHVL